MQVKTQVHSSSRYGLTTYDLERSDSWGVRPLIVTGDSWYSGVENLKFLRNQELANLFAVEKNRTVSNEPKVYCQVQSLEIPDDGLVTHLKDFGASEVV